MTQNALSATRMRLRAFLGIWCLVWLGVGISLFVFWQALPTWAAWGLSFVEALMVPDLRTLKEHFITKDAEAKKPHGL